MARRATQDCLPWFTPREADFLVAIPALQAEAHLPWPRWQSASSTNSSASEPRGLLVESNGRPKLEMGMTETNPGTGKTRRREKVVSLGQSQTEALRNAIAAVGHSRSQMRQAVHREAIQVGRRSWWLMLNASSGHTSAQMAQLTHWPSSKWNSTPQAVALGAMFCLAPGGGW